MRKAIVAAVAVAGLGVACFPQGMCESTFVDYCGPGDTTCQGKILDATHWESAPFDGTWLPYGPEQTIRMHMRDAVTGQVLTGQIVGWDLEVNADQTVGGGILPVVCGDALCEVNENTGDPSAFDVHNDTCSSEFVRAVVTLLPSDDAGADGSAAATGDAGTDSSADSSTDAATE